MAQERVPVEKLREIVSEKVSMKPLFEKIIRE